MHEAQTSGLSGSHFRLTVLDRHIQHAVRQQLLQPGVLCFKCFPLAGIGNVHPA